MSRNSGFTLIEVLIAFIILAVGLLAIVSLQGTSKQYTHQAMQRSLAVSHAESIIERIRANPTALLTYTGAATIGGGSIVNEPNPSCTDVFCTNVQLATHDMWVFEQKLDGSASSITEAGVTTNTSGLIAPLACMDFTPRAPLTRTGFLTIRIQWTGLQELSDAVTVAGTNCGGADAGDDPFRRQVVVNTYVIDETEL
jgi:type IV pilus assembly protein PilV